MRDIVFSILVRKGGTALKAGCGRALRSPWTGLLFLVGCFNTLAVWEMRRDTCTVDEAIHLLAGYTYITERDFSVNTEHPPLQKILAAIPAALGGLARSTGDPPSFLYDSANPDLLLLSGRLSTLFWGNVLLLSVFGVASRAYGSGGGLLAAAMAAFCPNLLAHSHFVTNDVPVAALLLLSLACLSDVARRPSVPRCLAAGVLLGGTLCTKFSAVVLVPVAVIVIATRQLLRKRRAAAAGSDVPGGIASGLRGLVWGGLLLGTAVDTVWAVYGFRFSGKPAGGLEIYLRAEGLIGSALHTALANQVLPEAYLKGLGMVLDHSTFGHKAYALGQYSDVGWWWYFPVACLVKVPVAVVILVVLGGWAWARRTRRGYSKDFALVQFMLLYGGFCISSKLNIGIRHVLPIFPMAYVLAGGILYPRGGVRRRLRTLAVAGLLIWTALDTVYCAPHFLAYFNVPSRVLVPRYSLLVDSNLDWGQDLARLNAFLEERRIREVKLSYFGNGSPRHLGLRHVMIPFGNWYQHREREWAYTERLRPGDYLAISATNYVGVLEDSHRRYYLDRLRGLRPIAEIGHSILVFRLPETWKE